MAVLDGRELIPAVVSAPPPAATEREGAREQRVGVGPHAHK
jgi:hypothetical protein